jgi:hypothetical protein
LYSVEKPETFDGTPELGMGFHFGVTQPSEKYNKSEGVIVLNAQLALTPKDILDFWLFERWQETQGREIVPGVVATMIMAPEPAPKRSILPSEDAALFIATFGNFVANSDRYEMRSKLHASPPFPLQTREPEYFVRFSAFKNDRRVGADGSLLPGTYVTSKRDAEHVPSGFAAVGRYALPNPMSAIHRFDALAPGGTVGWVGTVLPSFGQSGGGVEIKLTKGLPMQIELRKDIINRLMRLPENGMGYQLVDLVLADGRVVPSVMIFNCEIANLPERFRDVRPSDVADVRPAHSKTTLR